MLTFVSARNGPKTSLLSPKLGFYGTRWKGLATATIGKRIHIPGKCPLSGAEFGDSEFRVLVCLVSLLTDPVVSAGLEDANHHGSWRH